MSMEKTIISNMLLNKDFFAKSFPYIKSSYFEEDSYAKIFESISEYVEEYKETPSLESLSITLENRKDLNESSFSSINSMLVGLTIDEKTNQDWLVNETEKFCQDRDLYNSIRQAILILDNQVADVDKGSIPQMISDSLGISFDTSVGHDFLEDFEDRYDYYHRKETRIPFDIDMLNSITKGGIPNKSLTLFLGATGTGKSIVKCHMAATNLLHGKNVLYITMELAEEEVARRIDANILNIMVDEVAALPIDVYKKKIERYKANTPGKLIIKEYPTASAHVGHFRHLLNEIKQKKGFYPDVIYIDYLNICASSRMKGGASVNSYTLVKSIAEEVRGLAMEFGVPIVSSSQLNRDGYNNSDVDLTNTSESMGITHTADAIFALITNDDLEATNQIMIKQLKNRWGDISTNRKFVIGMDKARMKLYNMEGSANENIDFGPSKKEDKPVMDSSLFGQETNPVEIDDPVMGLNVGFAKKRKFN